MSKSKWCETCKHQSYPDRFQCPHLFFGLLCAEAGARSCPEWEGEQSK